MSDLVASWEVPLYDRTHKIEFEHGTTTGRRVVKVDGEVRPFRPRSGLTYVSLFQVITKKDWMFKLVGNEPFQIKGLHGDTFAKCEIVINACSGFTYEYVLYVNGKQFKTFRDKQSRIMRTWHFDMQGKEWRIVLGKCLLTSSASSLTSQSASAEKDTLDIWVNGQKKETMHEFAEDGTEMAFELEPDLRGCIKTASSGHKKQGMVYILLVNDTQIVESCT